MQAYRRGDCSRISNISLSRSYGEKLMKKPVWVLLNILLLLSTTLPGAAQDKQRQDQKKKADQDWVVELKSVLVELRAVVTNRQGHVVEGLRKEDFEIREKGRVQAF